VFQGDHKEGVLIDTCQVVMAQEDHHQEEEIAMILIMTDLHTAVVIDTTTDMTHTGTIIKVISLKVRRLGCILKPTISISQINKVKKIFFNNLFGGILMLLLRAVVSLTVSHFQVQQE